MTAKLGRPKLPPKECNWPGCTNPRRSAQALRCIEHPGDKWHMPQPRRDPKPERGATYCLPCRRWFPSFMHQPIKRVSTS